MKIAKIYDVIIMGGGPAGIFAATLAHIKGLKPLLVESNNGLGGQPMLIYSQKNIEDYPGYTNIKAYELMNKFISQFLKTRIPFFLETTINSYQSFHNTFIVKLSNQKIIHTKSIVIACGPGMFTSNQLELKHNNKVHYVVDDLQKYKNKKVIILGGGDSAVDWANEIINVTKHVSIVHRRNEFRANGLNVKRLTHSHIQIYLDYLPIKMQNNLLSIQSNSNQKIKHLPFDYILVQYGQKIDTSHFKIFKNLKITKSNRIPVQINQMTNLKNIYAVGNACIYEGKPSSIICAHGEASVAIRDILNNIKQYDVCKK